MADRDAIPRPPADLAGERPPTVSAWPDELWRLHWEDDPNAPAPRDPGRWRFDAPTGDYPVTYANVSRHHVFAEVYCDTDGAHEIGPDQADRRISVAAVQRALVVIDLGDAAVMNALGVDLRLCTTTDYVCTQRWGRRIREWLPAVEAIRYPGRKAGVQSNYCLFLDRCADALLWTSLGTVSENADLVFVACELFRLAPRVLLEPPEVTWR